MDQADPGDYDGLVLPGGVANPDQLRTNPKAVAFARAFFESGKPVGVICHGPRTLIEADVVKGRTMTSWPSLKTGPACNHERMDLPVMPPVKPMLAKVPRRRRGGIRQPQ